MYSLIDNRSFSKIHEVPMGGSYQMSENFLTHSNSELQIDTLTEMLFNATIILDSFRFSEEFRC